MTDNTKTEGAESSPGEAGSATHENPVRGSSRDKQVAVIAGDDAPLNELNGGLDQGVSASGESADATDTRAKPQDKSATTLGDATVALPAPVLEGNALSAMLDSIEARVAACEKYLGRREDIFRALEVSETGGGSAKKQWPATATTTTTGNAEGSAEEAGGPRPADLEKWQQLLRNSLQPTMPLGTCLQSLQRLTDQLVGGKASEVNGKLMELQSWIQAENPSLSRIILGLETKKAYLLQNEQRIRSLAELLKRVDALKEFVNPPSLTDIVLAEKRLSQLEQSSAALAHKAKQLQTDMEEMCLDYNNAMQVVLQILTREPATELRNDSDVRPVVEKPTTTAAE